MAEICHHNARYMQYLTLEKGVNLHLNEVEFDLPKEELYGLNLPSASGQTVNVFLLIFYWPLEKGSPSFVHTKFLSPKNALCHAVEIA